VFGGLLAPLDRCYMRQKPTPHPRLDTVARIQGRRESLSHPVPAEHHARLPGELNHHFSVVALPFPLTARSFADQVRSFDTPTRGRRHVPSHGGHVYGGGPPRGRSGWTRRSTARDAMRWKSLSRTQVGVTTMRTIES
jgi:hypothetical protein